MKSKIIGKEEFEGLELEKELNKRGIRLNILDRELVNKIVINDHIHPRNHFDFVGTMFTDIQDDNIEHTEPIKKRYNKYIYDIARKYGVELDDTRSTDIKQIVIDDISQGKGTRRDVDRVLVDTTEGMFAFTVSIEKAQGIGHNQAEFDTLKEIHELAREKVDNSLNYTEVTAGFLQAMFGLISIDSKDDIDTKILLKEYVFGWDVEDYLSAESDEVSLKQAFFKAGEMLGTFYSLTSRWPLDMTFANMVINRGQDGAFLPVRPIDLGSGMKSDIIIATELSKIFNEIETITAVSPVSYAEGVTNLVRGILVSLDKERGYKFLEIVREGFAENDKIRYASMIENLVNDFADNGVIIQPGEYRK